MIYLNLMPPRRRQEVIVVNQNIVCSRHLTGQVFEMKKQLNIQEECCICLENLLECKACYTLLICGHALHSRCYMDSSVEVCPLCRTA